MSVVLFMSGAVLLFIGHYFKILRWKQMIEIYEQPGRATLLNALSVGQIINFFLPFRVGDLVRAILSGKKLENGVPFSVATIIVDHYLDVPIIGAVFCGMWLTGIDDPALKRSLIFYSVLLCGLLFSTVLAFFFSVGMKKIIRSICSVFNAHIEFWLLFFSWGCITAFKDIFVKIKKSTLFLYSFMMWAFYLGSYICIAECLLKVGDDVHIIEVFLLLFSSGSVSGTVFINAFQMVGGTWEMVILLSTYMVLPLLIIFLFRFLPVPVQERLKGIGKNNAHCPVVVNLLPQINEADRLIFLENYFSNERREDLQRYLELNRDIRIIQDFSAGSNATTILCMDQSHTFYRKYAFGKDGDKLFEQIQWLHEHEGLIPLPKILKVQSGEEYCSYDMLYNATAVGLFNYIHSMPSETSWNTLFLALEDLAKNVHTRNRRPVTLKKLEEYIEQKVWANIKKIEASRELQPILAYDVLIINGTSYRNLGAIKMSLSSEFLFKLFAQDTYADIHGDLTVENIICWEANTEPGYYFIDPNTGNFHESPMLDYAKLLQSLHGGYEFLMKTKKVSVHGNQISFLSTCSTMYRDIFARYRAYLEEKFDWEQVRSIFFHEIVHWLRLLPYKIKKNGQQALLFYAGFIVVANDVIEWYGDNLCGKS